MSPSASMCPATGGDHHGTVRWAAIDAALRAVAKLAPEGVLRDPPLFIVGAPRSGTTLAYQLACTAIRTSYFCNLANRHPGAAVGATFVMRGRFGARRAFASSYGETAGKAAPSQGDAVWSRFLGSDRSYDEQFRIPAEARAELARLLASIAGVVGAPFVGKSIANSVKIHALAKTFPDAVFVWVRREPLMTAQSHYLNLARRPDLPWMSAKPSNFGRLCHLDLPERAAAQVVSIEADIGRALREIDRRRYLSVSYESVCDDPASFVEKVSTLWKSNGATPVKRIPPPGQFVPSTSIRVPAAILQRLERAVARDWAMPPTASQTAL